MRCLMDRAAVHSHVPRSDRKIGRPLTGRLTLSEDRVDILPERGGYREMARALGVSLGAIQQWVAFEQNPLPTHKEKGKTRPVINRGDLVRWLIETRRYSPK